MRGRRRALGSVVLWVFALAGTAGAADYGVPYQAPSYGVPVRARADLPPYVNWTGCYIGGYIGGAFSERDTTFTDLGNNTFRAYSGGIVAGRAENPHSWDVGSNSSVIGGGTVGCNYQPMGSPLLVGIEGEAGYMKLKGSAFDPFRSPTVGAVTPDVLGTAKTGDWYGMVTARLGYSWGSVMTYVKGGVAFLQVQGSVVDACNNTGSGCGNWLIATTSSSDTFTAGTLGAGAEWAFAGNWSLKAEYMYIGLGDTHTITTCGVATTPAGATVGGGAFCFNHDFGGVHTAKVGVNYRFGPVW
jgi:outer membrane immunogenic protein